MDLYAYAQIGDLEHLLEENKIEIKRLRGLRLMTDQKPVTEEEANERIEHEKLEYAVNWLRQHSDCCWSSSYMYKHHKAFIYGKPDENGDREVVAIDFSKVHGKTRKHIKFAWKKIVKDYHAQYDMWNEYVGKNVLYVHARQGGGNRPWYPIDTKHPMYLSDVDDAWDSTYCDIYYDLSKAVVKENQMSKGYFENVDEYAYDYLYEMYKKYCPNGKLSDECPSLKGTPDGDIDIISREGAKWWDAIIYSKRCIEKTELFEKLTPGNPVWFYTYDDELHEGWVDFIECNQRDGWTVSMHYKPANKTGSVYTARLWKYSLEEYGKRFACTKEELE